MCQKYTKRGHTNKNNYIFAIPVSLIMQQLKTKIAAFVIACCFTITGSFAQTDKPLFPGHPGVVSYTYRDYFAKDVARTLDVVQANSFTDIEFSSLFGKSPAELRAMIDARGIKCSSYGVGYNDLIHKTDSIAKNALILGAQYVRVAGIPHKGDFTLDEAKMAVADFNRAGKYLKEKYGLTFIYHNHGFEFQPYKDGTLYDYIVQNTDPNYVSFELDILWAFFPGQDPAKLIGKYGERYKALHLKDIKKGIPGNLSGGTNPDNEVALGQGAIDIPSVIKAAVKAHIRHYYIEDESSRVLQQVPVSIAYLESLRY
jgi:sugar phosphate isomerase/epimerase